MCIKLLKKKILIDISGVDPEGGDIRYSISGPIFTVDRETGVVRLQQQLDREKQDLVEVIISITGMCVCMVHVWVWVCFVYDSNI